MSLLDHFISFIHINNLFIKKDRLLLAVSGGVDSVVLCHLCKGAGFDFMIAHCNFKLRGPDSDRDEAFVKELAEKYSVPFFVKSFDTISISKEGKKSIEETARELRYAWFEELVNGELPIVNGERVYIVTAHHADDNMETVLMNFFRGTGIKGLRGILPKQNNIVRPLLFARKKEMETYAEENHLLFVTDYTNAENVYTRNFLRNQLIPMVKEYFPQTEENLLNNIERFSEAEKLYNEAIHFHKKQLLEVRGEEVHVPVLKLKKTNPLKTVLYEIIKEFGFSSSQVKEVITLLNSESGKYVSSPTHQVIKNRNWLIIAPLSRDDADLIIIDGEGEYAYPGGNLLLGTTTNHKLQTTNSTALLNADEIIFPLILRKWKAGDYFYPLGMQKKKKLARFFIDQKLSKTDKERTWVVEMNKKIIWVVGHRIDDRVKVTDQTKKILRITSI